MNIEEFEQKLMYFARNSEEKIISTNISYYLGITSDEAKKHLQTLADKAFLLLDSDDDGNLYYTMPNVPRKSNPEELKAYFFPSGSKSLSVNSSSKGRKCPYCMESIKPNAKKCKHCGEIVDIVLIKQQRGLSGTGKKNFPHLIHLAITFLTSGAWFIVWMLLFIFRDKNKYI